VLIALGLLAAAGAALAWWLGEQEKAPAKDPWASQAGGADPWASRTPTSSGTTPEVAGAYAPATSTTGTADVSGSATSPSSQSFGVGSAAGAGAAGTAAATTGTTGTTSDSGSYEQPRMLDSEEIDELASDEPTTADEQAPGESPTEEIASARAHHGEPVAHESGTASDSDDDSVGHEEAEARDEADSATWSGAIDRSDPDDRAGLGTGPDVDADPAQPPLDRPEAERRYDDRSTGI
ncbi:hypothetical protein ACFFN0_06370, partial [Ornithinimicrobium kibberense]